MKKKNIIIITILLLLLATILFGLSWYLNKKRGVGTPSPIASFREFLGIGQRLSPTDSGQDFGADFEDNPLNDANYDKNNNGIPDWLEDLNGNGVIDGEEDLNGNGTADGIEDANNNGIPDIYEVPGGTGTGNVGDGDGTGPGGDIGDGNTGDGGDMGDGNWGDGGDTGPGEWPGGDDWGNGGNTGDGGDTGPGGSTGDGGTVTGTEPGTNTTRDEGNTVSFDTGSGIDFAWGDNFERLTEGIDTQACRVDDININFNEEELAMLRGLEERFNQIAEELYSRDVVEEQKSLYSQLKLKYYRLAELNSFCQQNAPLITDPKMQRKVATPFWNEGSQDSLAFTNYVVSTSDENSYGKKPAQNYENVATLLERIFRINIW